jgi:hypothetical protein
MQYLHPICSLIRFLKELAAIAMMLDEEEKNAAPSDKKKHLCVHNSFRNRKSGGEYWTV